MKTFLNVLYRRILYKIPLKLLLILVVVFGVLFACFSNAVSLPQANWGGNRFNSEWDYVYSADLLSIGTSTTTFTFSDYDFVCIIVSRFSECSASYSINNSNFYNVGRNGYTCIQDKTFYLKSTSNNCGVNAYYYKNGEGFLLAPYTSLQCQTEYNLIPISSVDSNYCQSNNLCPVCPSVPVGTGGYSQLYINNILHLGAPNIIMNIPDEIDWDYAYTQGGQNMNIDVVGYNVDYEKIDSIVQFQNYKPSSEDFQKIIGLLTPYTKIIVFFVFLFIVWAWIKKPFKSKKL